MEHIKLSLHKHTAAIPKRLNEEGRWSTASNKKGEIFTKQKVLWKKTSFYNSKIEYPVPNVG